MVSVEFNRFINYYKKTRYLLNQVKDVKEAMIESLENNNGGANEIFREHWF
jgi:hypothetical protein